MMILLSYFQTLLRIDFIHPNPNREIDLSFIQPFISATDLNNLLAPISVKEIKKEKFTRKISTIIHLIL